MMDLVLYHLDLDGFSSAAIVNYFIGDNNNLKFVKMNYGFSVPWDKIKKANKVYMLDYSFQPFSDMIKLYDMKGKNFIWIDHHVTAIEDYNRSGQRFEGLREVGKAGCELTWEYFSNGLPTPRSIRMLGRFDVWDHSHNEDVVPFQYGMKLRNLDPQDNNWIYLIENKLDYYHHILSEGLVVQRYQKAEYDNHCKSNYFNLEWQGLKFICINAMKVSSQLFDGYYDSNIHDAMMVFGWTGNMWTISMYTDKEGIDVGKIAKENSGGGHRGASGFQTNDISFILDNRLT